MKSNIMERLQSVFYDEKPSDGKEYILIAGRNDNSRCFKYIRADYVNKVKNLNFYKVFIPKANGSKELGCTGQMDVFGPNTGYTETFFSAGSFKTKEEAVALLKYMKSKFARALFGILKRTQNVTPSTWRLVPLQDFTSSSDIDWSLSISEIDAQLYKKYKLTKEEIAFIESNVKEMN